MTPRTTSMLALSNFSILIVALQLIVLPILPCTLSLLCHCSHTYIVSLASTLWFGGLAGCVGQGAVVVGAAAAEAHEDHRVHGSVERQAACNHGPGGNPNRPLG